MNKKKTQQEIANELMQHNMQDVETHFLKWMNYLFKDYSINSFLEVADNSIVWMKFAEVMRLKTIAFEAEFFNKKSIENYVLMLTEIWDQKNIKIFNVFSETFKESFSEDFEFETDFIDFIYSHTQEIIFVILIVSLLTVQEIKKIDEETEAKAFTIIKSFEDEDNSSKLFLGQIFDQVVKMFDCYEETLQEENNNFQQPFNSLPNSNVNRKRVNTIADMEVLKKIEKQQKLIDEFEKENELLKSELNEKQKVIDDQQREIEEKDDKNKNLVYQREDLLEQLQNKKLDLASAEVEEKNNVITKLQMRNEELLKKNNILEREEEDFKEEIKKLNMQLDNYQHEFEKVQQISQRQSHESNSENIQVYKQELQDLKIQCKNLQDEVFEEKQKCIDLDMKIGSLNMEMQNLKMDKQDLEFKLENMEQTNNILNDSDIYEEDFLSIQKELNSDENILQLKNLPNDTNLLQKYESIFKAYENKCLSKIKTIVNENIEKKEKAQELYKENEEIKQEMDEISERIKDLENNIVHDQIQNNPKLNQIFTSAAENQSEIAQDLLKTIMKNEYEIERLRFNRRRLIQQNLNEQAQNLDKVHTLYTIIENYIIKQLR